MNPITDYPENEKPAKKKRVGVWIERANAKPVIPTPAPEISPNADQSNVMTREQWEAHLKKIAE